MKSLFLKLSVLPLCFVMVFSNTTHAQAVLGSGFQCINGVLEKRGKVNNSKKTLKSLSKKKKSYSSIVKTSSGKTKKRAQKKLKSTKNLISSIKNCVNGTLASSGETLTEVVRSIAGDYPAGSYQFDLGGLVLDGPITANFSLDGSVLNGTIYTDTFLQLLFGADPLQISGETKKQSFPLKFEIPGTPVGLVKISLNSDLTLSLVAEDIPSAGIGSINWNGEFQKGIGFVGAVQFIDKVGVILYSGNLSLLK